MIKIKHAGIFAAGLGERFAKTFPGTPKPMIPILQKPLIEWTLRLLVSAGFQTVTILLNSKGRPVREHLKKTFPDVNFIFIIKDTASSYESFRLVSQTLAPLAEGFILSAVDSFYKPEVLKTLSAPLTSDFDAVLTVTGDIRDEKPLWVDIDKNKKITAMGSWAKDKKYATGGLYLMTQKLVEQMPPAGQFKALREYLTELILTGKKVLSLEAEQSVDIDMQEDIKLAEKFIKANLIN